MTVRYEDAVIEQLTTSYATAYTCPSTAKSCHVIYGNVSNVTSSTSTVTVNIVQNGAGATTTNVYVPTKSVTANDSDPLSELVGAVLKPGDFVSAKAGHNTRLNFKVGIKEIY